MRSLKTQASQRFGVYTFEECKLKRKEILEAIFTEAKTIFQRLWNYTFTVRYDRWFDF